MATRRICPECDERCETTICPRCGSRTLAEHGRQERPDPMIGRVLDERYRIDSLIGRGGMGAVYRGVQLATMQVVAIKVIRSELAENAEAARRFHREVRVASRLAHPHTIRVFDFGQSEEGDLYMVLEYLNGRTLAKVRKEEGRLSESRIAGIASEVCQSLMESHGLGLAHRDLKPDNIMLLDTPGHPDFVKVLDFGIAKFLSGSSGESSVTRVGSIVGTPQYMAPEQAHGNHAISPAVDIYALGIVVFEALTGVKPFDGDSAVGILMSHVRDPIPDLPADLPVLPETRALLRRMLAKEPTGRPSAAEAAKAFERIKVLASGDDEDASPATVAISMGQEAGDRPDDEADEGATRMLETPFGGPRGRGDAPATPFGGPGERAAASRRWWWLAGVLLLVLASGVGWLAWDGVFGDVSGSRETPPVGPAPALAAPPTEAAVAPEPVPAAEASPSAPEPAASPAATASHASAPPAGQVALPPGQVALPPGQVAPPPGQVAPTPAPLPAAPLPAAPVPVKAATSRKAVSPRSAASHAASPRAPGPDAAPAPRASPAPKAAPAPSPPPAPAGPAKKFRPLED